MLFLYNIFLHLLLIAGFPVWILLILKEKYRHTVLKKLYFFPVSKEIYRDKKFIMIHGVSVGEINAAIPLICRIKKKHPLENILITCSTYTGFKNARKKCTDDLVVYFPFDFLFSLKNFFNSFQITRIFIFETEFWPNFINYAYRKNIPIYIANARISDKSFPKYLLFKSFLAPILKKINFFFCQSSIDSTRLEELGALKDKIIKSGNMKFDSAKSTLEGFNSHALREKIPVNNSSPVFIAGSTQELENSICLDCFLELKKTIKDLKFILVPRKPETLSQVLKKLQSDNIPFSLRSKISETSPVKDILLVDTIGDLFGLYHFADIVFIGKSFINGGGGQNPLEPAVHGKAVIMGPSYENFREIVERMIEKNAILIVKNPAHLKEKLLKLFNDPTEIKKLGLNAKNFVIENASTCDKIIERIF